MIPRRWARRIFPRAANYRGETISVWLGSAVVWAIVLGTLTLQLPSRPRVGSISPDEADLVWFLPAFLLVWAVGMYDDYRPGRTRGLVSQLAALRHGVLSPGAIKMAGILIAAGVVAWGLGARGARLALAVPVIAGSANLWNLLDVAPGRALKWFIPAAAVLLVVGDGPLVEAILVVSLGVAAVALVVDLLEWSMLGDGGANPLGFVVGVALFLTLSLTGLAIALATILVLHVVAETVTLTRVLRSFPPLRWFDDLGRRSTTAAVGSDTIESRGA